MPLRVLNADALRLLGKAARSKYNVDRSASGIAARTYQGIIYDSLAEARYAAQLDIKLRGGLITAWERQIAVPLIVNGIPIAKMVADFQVWHADQRCEFVEVKGMVLPIYKLKLKLFRALYPDTLYTVVNAKEIL